MVNALWKCISISRTSFNLKIGGTFQKIMHQSVGTLSNKKRSTAQAPRTPKSQGKTTKGRRGPEPPPTGHQKPGRPKRPPGHPRSAKTQERHRGGQTPGRDRRSTASAEDRFGRGPLWQRTASAGARCGRGPRLKRTASAGDRFGRGFLLRRTAVAEEHFGREPL